VAGRREKARFGEIGALDFAVALGQLPIALRQRHAQPQGLHERVLDVSCEVDEQEIQRGGVSYSIDTVRTYVERFPKAQLYYLIGADHVSFLPKWREARELARLVEFVVIPRPGELLGLFPEPFRGRSLHGFPLGVSASQIRERVRAGLPIDWLVPASVAEAIRNNRLYL
jgi:nicotinate-nucleotide adenylyltransferase